jgi:putative transposase
MRKAFQYRVYPTAKQERLLNQMLEECRWVFNQTLALRKDAWEQRQESISLYQSNALLPEWKRRRPSLTMVYSQVLQDVQERVDLAFKAFFRRVKAGEKPGYPRFRGKGRYDSLTYPQFGFSLEKGSIKAAKIGTVKAVIHRPLEGKMKALTLRRRPTGKWYACFSCEVEPEPLPPSEKAVGIDVGLESFATLSTGDKIANPHFFRTDEKALAKAQRKLSKAEKGTPERAHRRKAVSHIHERIANRRKDFAHKLSRNLVNDFGIIVFEKLNGKAMLKNHCLAKSIADASWQQLVQFTSYKAEWAGRKVILVDPRNTSRRCSRCGTLVDKDLSCRIHSCPICGLVLDRDLNASYNILALGLQSLGKIPRSPALL